MKLRSTMIGVMIVAVSTSVCAKSSPVPWQADFRVARDRLGAGPGNAYFPLTPNQTLVYKSKTETDTVTVLKEIMRIDGVQTRVVEDRVVASGQLQELTRDYYADDRITHDVYYLGEDVNVYRNGRVINHAGSWRSGKRGAHFGLIMPAIPKRGMRFYQERARGAGMDRAEIIATDGTTSTPAGTFHACIIMRETNPMEPSAIEIKYYAPNVGVVKDSDAQLVRIIKQPR